MAGSYHPPDFGTQLDGGTMTLSTVSQTEPIHDTNQLRKQHSTEHLIESGNEGTVGSLEEPQLQLESDDSVPEASTAVSQTTIRHEISNEASQAEATVGRVPKPTPTSPSTSTITLSQSDSLPIRKSLGIWGCLVIIGGSFGTLAGLGFLIFLWTGRGSDGEAVNATHAWRAIALHQWIPQAVTLTAIFIRVIVAAQATICTAMLASLILEKRKVQKSQVAQFSVMRGINDGPLKLLRLLLPSRETILHVESLLVLALTLSTFGLQFSTTILFSDISDGAIAGDMMPVHVKHYISSEVHHIYIADYQEEAPVNAIFGEVPSNWSSAPDLRGFSDGGLKQRSFLPFDKQPNRTAISHFKGDGVTMNSRVTCMRPEIEGSYEAIIENPLLGSRSVKIGRINGTLHYGQSLRGTHSNSTLCNSRGCQSTTFDCVLPAGADESIGYQSAFCSVTIVDGQYWNGTGSIGWNIDDGPWTSHSMVQLVYSNNVYSSVWPQLVEPRKLADASRTDYGEWSSFELLPGKFLNISLCFAAFNIDLQYLDMTADGRLHEPSGNWSLIGIGDSSAVRTYLGTDPSHPSPDERGILTIKEQRQPEMNSKELEDSDDWVNKTLATWNAFQQALYISFTRNTGGLDPTWQGCNTCYITGTTMHPELSQLFGDTLKITGRAAEAIQSFMTAFSLILYTEFYKALQGTIEVHVSFLETVQVPQLCSETGCRGLISVASLLGFHLICVLLTSVLFIYQVRYSRQGNIWHAISQLMGDELGDILAKGNNTDDKAIEKLLKKEGTGSFVKLNECDRGLIGFVQASSSFQSDGCFKRWKGWLSRIIKMPKLTAPK
ncbi:hypothetical protein F4680DRAFT_205611 [Xylaria scruposa]|nr:hypothetical protein F4680DRAFT_205611 [Xylaria scruposa]